MLAPSTPRLASSGIKSRGKASSAKSCAARGMYRSSTKRRTLCWIRRSSSLSCVPNALSDSNDSAAIQKYTTLRRASPKPGDSFVFRGAKLGPRRALWLSAGGMPSVRLLSLAALGTAAFSSCSAGEIARPGPDRGAEVSAPIATLTIPAPEPTSPALEPVLPEPAPAVATDDADDDEEPGPSSSLRELEPTVEPGRLLVAIGRETLVYERPSFKSQ